MMNDMFDDLRPYQGDEVPAAIRRIAESQLFPLLASYVYPDKDIEASRLMVADLTTVAEFQSNVMLAFTKQVLKRSIKKFTYGGLQHINPQKRYLFVANHRDIVLDASLLEYVMHVNGYDTTEVTFGSNLMMNQLIVDIGKCNKMFKVERGGNMKDFYRNSVHLSEYIRHALIDKKQSVWIAQRNGRTKDGNDVTDQGIIKMLSMSGSQDRVKSIAELNVVPVAISYEWEPCDVLKMLELYESRSVKYIKKPGEDLNSILTGIVQQKGDVHIEFCKPLSLDELQVYNDCTGNEFNKHVAMLIDKRIYKGYRLMANNYIAHDLLYGQRRFGSFYTESQKNDFIEYLRQIYRYDDCDINVLCDIFLGIYANPVVNVRSCVGTDV